MPQQRTKVVAPVVPVEPIEEVPVAIEEPAKVVLNLTEVTFNIGLPTFGTVVFPVVRRLRDRVIAGWLGEPVVEETPVIEEKPAA